MWRAVLIGVCVVGVASSWVLWPSYREVDMTVGDLRVTMAWAGGDRAVTVTDRTGDRARIKLIAEWGPHLRTNLYRAGNDAIAIVDFAGSWTVTPTPALRVEAARLAEAWVYVGTILSSGFYPPGEASECMDMLVDDSPPPDRSAIYRRSCPPPLPH